MFPKIGVKPPKWIVYFMENPIKMDDLEYPLFWDRHPHGFPIVTSIGMPSPSHPLSLIGQYFGGETLGTSLRQCDVVERRK